MGLEISKDYWVMYCNKPCICKLVCIDCVGGNIDYYFAPLDNLYDKFLMMNDERAFETLDGLKEYVFDLD